MDESLSINIFNSNEGQSTSDLNGEFIHSQLLIECLIRMISNSNDKNELIEFCKQQYKENDKELKISTYSTVTTKKSLLILSSSSLFTNWSNVCIR